MITDSLTRRDFFRSLRSILVVPWLSGLLPEPQAHAFADQLVRVFGHSPRAAHTIGYAYLQGRPEERDLILITKRIIARDAELVNCLDKAYQGPLERILKRCIAEDFSSGNTVQLNGWVLAKTEVRLCALRVLA
jgi:hypothetical protein